MTQELAVALLALAALGVAAWQWRAQFTTWRARRAPVLTVGGPPTSTRMTITWALAAGILAASNLGAWITLGVAQLGALTGLNAWIGSPASTSTVAAAAVGVGCFDIVARGLWRGATLRPGLRHAPIAAILPALLIAGAPLLGQAGVDLGDRVASVPAAATCTTPDGSEDVAGYGGDQLAVAGQIVQVGRDMGVPQRGQVIAVATAMQESGLDVDAVGDGGSAIGPFQQHPSYGTTDQRRDVATAARAFYDRMLAVRSWAELPLWQAAQAVQRSAHPTAYAKRETAAAQVVGASHGTTCRS